MIAFPGVLSSPVANAGTPAQGFPIGPLSPPPTFSTTTTEPQTITLAEAESHYCTTCKTYPNLNGIQNDYYEAKVQPNGAGTTWYIHFPTTNGVVVNGLETTQSYNSASQVLMINLTSSNTKLDLADRQALTYTFNLNTGYQEVDVLNLTALKGGSGGTMSLEYSNTVETGDIFQFVPFPNGAMLDNDGQPTVLGNCTTGTPDCLYSSGYMVFGEASLTRTCVSSKTATTSYSGSKTTAVSLPSGDCALSAKCGLHSTTTTVSTTSTVLESETCTYSYSSTCSSTNTSTTFTTSAKLPGCDESDWTAASVLHNWGDTNNYQKLDALENSWEITGITSSGVPAFAIKLDDLTDKYGDRSQLGNLEWLDTYQQETLGLNSGDSLYQIVPSQPVSSSKCKTFEFGIPTSRGSLNGTITVTPYIGTGCSTSSSPNPFVASLTGTLTLSSASGPIKYTVNGVAVEFMCNETILNNCYLPIPTSVAISCNSSSLAVGQQVTCTGTVTNTPGDGSILPSGSVEITSSNNKVIPSGSCNLPSVTTTGTSASCSVTLTAASTGNISLSATYTQDQEEVHSGSGPSSPFDVVVS